MLRFRKSSQRLWTTAQPGELCRFTALPCPLPTVSMVFLAHLPLCAPRCCFARSFGPAAIYGARQLFSARFVPTPFPSYPFTHTYLSLQASHLSLDSVVQARLHVFAPCSFLPDRSMAAVVVLTSTVSSSRNTSSSTKQQPLKFSQTLQTPSDNFTYCQSPYHQTPQACNKPVATIWPHTTSKSQAIKPGFLEQKQVHQAHQQDFASLYSLTRLTVLSVTNGQC